MHIVIDDTHGPPEPSGSRYITGARRTHVAVVFPDQQVDHIRDQMRKCLNYLASLLPSEPTELHFTDIYNRRGVWKHLDRKRNLYLLEPFAKLYQHYRWKVFLQTVDDHTLRDWPKLTELPGFDDLDPKNRADLSLLLLSLQIRIAYKQSKPPIRLIVDQGAQAPKKPFGAKLFADWGAAFSGYYESSAAEPLLQIADFIAFCINRNTYLSMKQARTPIDYVFMKMVSDMKLDCDQLKVWTAKPGFAVADFDDALRQDRVEKGLE